MFTSVVAARLLVALQLAPAELQQTCAAAGLQLFSIPPSSPSFRSWSKKAPLLVPGCARCTRLGCSVAISHTYTCTVSASYRLTTLLSRSSELSPLAKSHSEMDEHLLG